MPTRLASITSLAESSLLYIFQLLCDVCGPEVPGTCWLVRVCKQWRDLDSNVKGLRVLFQGSQQQQVVSFCTWSRRHAGQVVALAFTSAPALEALSALAEAATAAAARGQALPLQRLVVFGAQLQRPQECNHTLQPLFSALPHLRHLHLSLTAFEAVGTFEHEEMDVAAANVLAPLQDSTSLTSLVLNGPIRDALIEQEPHVELLSRLPATLCSLSWHFVDLTDPQILSFDHLTGLTHLRLSDDLRVGRMLEDLRDDAFTALRQLRKLELVDMPISQESLLACRDQLVVIAPRYGPLDLRNFSHLQSLTFSSWGPPFARAQLRQAPALLRLGGLRIEGTGHPPDPWNTPWALQHYSQATQLQVLDLEVHGALPALGLLALTQLQQLYLSMCNVGAPVALSWAAALPGLVNLQLLAVPAALTACWHPWLTGLTKLVVLELRQMPVAGGGDYQYDVEAAAAHVSRLLAPHAGSSSSSSGGVAGDAQQRGHLQMVCVEGFFSEIAQVQAAAEELHRVLGAALPAGLRGVHLFRGSWAELQACGVELWPAPVAARLQQLLVE